MRLLIFIYSKICSYASIFLSFALEHFHKEKADGQRLKMKISTAIFLPVRYSEYFEAYPVKNKMYFFTWSIKHSVKRLLSNPMSFIDWNPGKFPHHERQLPRLADEDGKLYSIKKVD